MVIESLGINPTRVVREGQGMIGGTSELLSRGQQLLAWGGGGDCSSC